MKEKESREIYRNIMVCYRGYKVVSWKTQEELNKILETEKVDWYVVHKGESYQIVRPQKEVI
jgi:hypothetical protein